MQKAGLFGVWLFLCLLPAAALTQTSLFSRETREPFIQARATVDVEEIVPGGGNGSLFIGRSGASLLAPYPKRVKPSAQKIAIPRQYAGQGTPQIIALRRLIAEAEAGPLGYDAVQYGASIKPRRPPTTMTLWEIYDWIDQTPGQPHAIGRYQFIPKTLRGLVQELGLPLNTQFTPQVQDQLADVLLDDAGLAEFTAGQLSRHGFMNNLAKIWAGFPNSTGRSHYHGYAGNKASISWQRFDAAMMQIFGDI